MGVDVKKDAGPLKDGPKGPRWIAPWIFGCLCLAAVSCSGLGAGTGSRPVLPQTYGEDLLAQQRLEKVLDLIQNGKSGEARAILESFLKEEGASRMGPSTILYLGAMQLLEKGEPAGLEASKKYFQACMNGIPEGPSRANAERIVRLLEGRIEKAEEEDRRRREREHLLEKQREEIQSLKYKIEKLEEIQKEADLKRESLDLE